MYVCIYCYVYIVYMYIPIEYTTQTGYIARIEKKMPKTTICIRVDGNVWDELQRLFPQKMSNKVDNFLKRLHSYTKNDLNALTIQELERKIDKMDQENATFQAKKDLLIIELEKSRQLQAAKEEEQIKKENAEALSKVKCHICGIPKKPEEIKATNQGIICRSCYLVTPTADLKKFMKEVKEVV